MQWRIDPSDQGGSYVYVPPKHVPTRLFITIMIRISDLGRNRYWSLPSVNLTTPVLLLAQIWLKHTNALLNKVELDKFKYNDCQRWNFIPDGVEIGTNILTGMRFLYIPSPSLTAQ
jgi:hypothetical protein